MIALFLAVFTMVGLIATPALAQQAGPVSLGDLARRVEQERATVKNPSRIYTNADIVAVEPPPVMIAPANSPVTVSGGEAAAGADTAKTGETESGEVQGNSAMPEEYWRNRAAFLRSEVDRGLALLDAARRNPINSAQDQQLTDTAVVRAQGMLDGLKKQWTQLEAAIKEAKLPEAWIAPAPIFP